MADVISIPELQHALYRHQGGPAFWLEEAIAVHFDGFTRKNLLPDHPPEDAEWEYSRESPWGYGHEIMRGAMIDPYTQDLGAALRLVGRHLGTAAAAAKLASVAIGHRSVEIRDLEGVLARELLLRAIPELKAKLNLP